MPRRGDSYVGNFGSYDAGGGGEFADDELAITAAVDEMFSCCGNPGQERLIGDYLSDFEDWAIDVLEVEGGTQDSFDAYKNMIIEDWYDGDMEKWFGTDIIWALGYDTIASQFGFHDSHDEQGEGTGR